MSTLYSIVGKVIDRVEFLIETASSGKEIEQCLSALERLESFCELRGVELDLVTHGRKEDLEKTVHLIALAGALAQLADTAKTLYEVTASKRPEGGKNYSRLPF